MSPRLPYALVAIAVLCACRNESQPSSSSSSPSSPSPSSSSEWSDFYGIQYRAPAGTNAITKDGELPGPGGLGGIPSGVRIRVALSHPAPQGFYVEIVKTAGARSLEAEKAVLLANTVGSNMVGKLTSTGWELTYDMPVTNDGAASSKAHVLYADLAGGHFECQYADVNCPAPAAAEAICRSMRPRPDK